MKHKKEINGRNVTKYPHEVGQFLFTAFIEDMQVRRAVQRWTQRDLGILVGVSHVTIGNYERRQAMPPVPEFLMICGVLDLNPMRYWRMPDFMMKQERMFKEETKQHG